MAKTVHCVLCDRPVPIKRKIGVGTLLLVLITSLMWVLVIPFYSKRCTICGGTEYISQKKALKLTEAGEKIEKAKPKSFRLSR